ncbi:MAG: type II secretion system protein GspD [Verrucomicrobiales bacterium]|nr:type II secretion system protein GspD [Verrucomicrobiales bacterium]
MTKHHGRWVKSCLAGLALAVVFTACQRYEETSSGARREPPKPAKTETATGENPSAATTEPAPAKTEKEEKPERPDKISYSADHDAEVKEIFDLAKQGRWEEAETLANSLGALDPQDTSIERLRSWVRTQREQQRAQALEDKIREIDAANSVFNPSLKSILTEQKDRGLPPRKDVRDVVEQIESTPYIPSSYGRTNYLKGISFEAVSEESRMSEMMQKRISVVLDNATLESIIFTVGQQEGINFIADKGLAAFQQKVSVNLDKVTVEEFLAFVARNYELQFQVGDDLIWIVDGKDASKKYEEVRFYRLRHGFILPAQFGPEIVNRTSVRQKDGSVVTTEQENLNRFVNDLSPFINPAIEVAITNFFVGKYQIDYERNLIVARGTREQMAIMDRIVQEFDKPLQQVLIEAKFITISEAAFMRLGVAWETGRLQFSSEQAQDFTGFGVGAVALPIQETFTNILNRPNLTATLSMLDQTGESQLLSAPRLTVVNNLPATISDGKVQYYYEEYQVKQQVLERRSSSALVPSGKPSKLTSGANLKVLASVGNDGKTIFLALNPSINSDVQLSTFATITDLDDQGNVVSTFDIKLPEYRTQDLSTRVVVRSGETVVMGGVLERQQTTFVEAVPILGSLPIIGAAFRRRTELDQPRYLLIFVTATLLSETGEYIIYEDEPGAEEPAPVGGAPMVMPGGSS